MQRENLGTFIRELQIQKNNFFFYVTPFFNPQIEREKKHFVTSMLVLKKVVMVNMKNFTLSQYFSILKSPRILVFTRIFKMILSI